MMVAFFNQVRLMKLSEMVPLQIISLVSRTNIKGLSIKYQSKSKVA